VACPAFAGADLDTGLIERQKSFLFPEAQPVPRDALLVATVGELLWEQYAARQAAKSSGDPWSPWHARDGWRMNLTAARTISFKDGDTLIDVRVRYGDGQWELTLKSTTAAWLPALFRSTRKEPYFCREARTHSCAMTHCTVSMLVRATAAA